MGCDQEREEMLVNVMQMILASEAVDSLAAPPAKASIYVFVW